jgi:hypothetical protein
LHAASALLAISCFPLWIAVISVVVIAISLRFNVSAQHSITKYILLSANVDGIWFVSKPNGDKSRVKIECVYLLGSFMLIKWMRFGSSYCWLTRTAQQTNNYWHRMKVFNRFYLS